MEEQQLPKLRRASRHIRTTKPHTLNPGVQTWVELSTKSRGLILVDPIRRLFGRHTCLVGNGIAQVEAVKPFRILVANFG